MSTIIMLMGMMTSSVNADADTATAVIAHRGASAHLPEHTLEAYLLAYGQGADFLEPDLVLTRDGVLIALHDLTLDATTDVAGVFPDRARADGLHYAIDFSLAELKRLNMGERIEPETGQARYPDRWPPGQGRFSLVTFDELVELTRRLNRSTGRKVGLYPEIKFPGFHAGQGQDISAALIAALDRHTLPATDLPVWIQCFEPEPLIALREAHGPRFTLVQLIGENDWAMNEVDYNALRSADGLARIVRYADGIGAPLERIVRPGPDRLMPAELMTEARRLGLAVHPYTLRRESMPPGLPLEQMLQTLIHEIGVEALFTDHPEVAVRVRDQR